jgi:hypothetical protein
MGGGGGGSARRGVHVDTSLDLLGGVGHVVAGRVVHEKESVESS